MKKLSFLAALTFMVLTSFGQITITSADLPAAGDTLRYSTTNQRLKYDTTGAGITWDYSAFVPVSQGIDSFRTALSINPIYAFSFGFSDFGLRNAAAANFGQIALSNAFNFYKKTSTKYTIEGYGAESNGIPIASTYSVPDKVYQFPLTYGRMDTTPYDVTISIPLLASIHMIGTRYNNVDGYGTIITPYGTFNCLRIKMTTKEVDSVTVTALNLSLGLPRTSLTYQWLANGQKTPVLEVQGAALGNTFTPTSIKYRDSIRFIAPTPIRADFIANLTTCTTVDTVTITNRSRPTGTGPTYNYTITPATYTFVGGTSATSANPKVIFTAGGVYTVSLHVQSNTGGSIPAVADTTKTGYITVSEKNNGIADLAPQIALSVYPNPAASVIHCNIGESNEAIHLSLSDITGRIVYSTVTKGNTTLQIPVDAIAAGQYLITAITSSGARTTRPVQVR